VTATICGKEDYKSGKDVDNPFIEVVNQVFGELGRYMQVGIIRAELGMAPELLCWPLKR
jgi:hypothetical protein